MKSKKPTKKPKPKGREKRSTHPTAPPTTPSLETAPAPLAKPKPVARMRRSLLSPAERKGAELVRYLRIHRQHPYGTRGENAIVRLAVEAGHLARLERPDLAERDDLPTNE
jgi:hypothetical protein